MLFARPRTHSATAPGVALPPASMQSCVRCDSAYTRYLTAPSNGSTARRIPLQRNSTGANSAPLRFSALTLRLPGTTRLRFALLGGQRRSQGIALRQGNRASQRAIRQSSKGNKESAIHRLMSSYEYFESRSCQISFDLIDYVCRKFGSPFIRNTFIFIHRIITVLVRGGTFFDKTPGSIPIG